MNFGEALEKAKIGYKIRRSGWNGKDQYVILGIGFSFCADGKVINAQHKDIGDKALIFVGTRGTQVGWLASQADLLSDDWEVV